MVKIFSDSDPHSLTLLWMDPGSQDFIAYLNNVWIPRICDGDDNLFWAHLRTRLESKILIFNHVMQMNKNKRKKENLGQVQQFW
jgi:hypothetical protein